MSGRIVVLNGVGSAGKSRLAREIQMQARGVVLHAAVAPALAARIVCERFDL